MALRGTLTPLHQCKRCLQILKRSYFGSSFKTKIQRNFSTHYPVSNILNNQRKLNHNLILVPIKFINLNSISTYRVCSNFILRGFATASKPHIENTESNNTNTVDDKKKINIFNSKINSSHDNIDILIQDNVQKSDTLVDNAKSSSNINSSNISENKGSLTSSNITQSKNDSNFIASQPVRDNSQAQSTDTTDKVLSLNTNDFHKIKTQAIESQNFENHVNEQNKLERATSSPIDVKSNTDKTHKLENYHNAPMQFDSTTELKNDANLPESGKKKEEKLSPDLMESKLKSEELPSSVQRYFFWRYSLYLNRFQQSLENEMPDTFQMFRIFSSGLRQFIIDFRDYIGTLLFLSLPGERLKDLTVRQLDLYYHMPRDMIRVFPVLAISSIPFGQNVAFPIAYWFPKTLLCQHFWTREQKFQFSLEKLRLRWYNARPVFRWLQVYLEDIADETLQDKCQNVYFKLGSGIHPTIEEVLELKPLFEDGPYQLPDIRGGYLNALLCLHGRSALPFRKMRLRDHAQYLHCLDMAILRENMDYFNNDKLSQFLFQRGINPSNLSRESMLQMLNDWLFISEQMKPNSLSLLLHLPIFLAYNHPTNLSIIN